MLIKLVDMKWIKLSMVCFCVIVTNSITVGSTSAESQVEIGDQYIPPPQPHCRIILKFKKVYDSLSFMHAYIVCETIDVDGNKTLRGYRGGPSGLNYESIPEGTDGDPNDPAPCGAFGHGLFGPIDQYSAPYDDDFPDHEEDGEDAHPTLHMDDLAFSDYCAICDCIGDALNAIEACCINYHPFDGPNSNTIIYMALELCMDPDDPPLDTLPGLLDVNVPGWEHNREIDNCIRVTH